MFNFHTKVDLETLQSGAGRPLLGRLAWDFLCLAPTFSWRSSLDDGERLLQFKAEICRQAGLSWVRHVSAFCFTNFLINMFMMSREAVSGQKIRVSDAGGSFNPCARPFGPFDQTNMQSLV